MSLNPKSTFVRIVNVQMVQQPENYAKIAKSYRSWIVCGIAEETSDGTLYNSAVVLSSTGELVACYRKIMLYELDETWCTPGSERMLIQTEFGSLAPAICMDLNDNELIYWMWRTKPDILAFVPTG